MPSIHASHIDSMTELSKFLLSLARYYRASEMLVMVKYSLEALLVDLMVSRTGKNTRRGKVLDADVCSASLS